MTKYIVVVTNLILIAPESQFFLYFWIMFKQINSLFIEDFFHIIKIEKKILYIIVLLVSILNMPTHFHLEIVWNSGLKPLWVFGQLCQKAQDKWDPSEWSSFAYNGDKTIDEKTDHYLSLADLLLTIRLLIFLTVWKMYHCDLLKMKISMDTVTISSTRSSEKCSCDHF